MKRRSKVLLGVAVVAVAAIGFFVWQNATREPVNPNLNAPTIALAKTDLVKTVSASGAVKSETTTNIYSTQSAYPVMEILVETGSAVKKGDVLARLDMSKLESEIDSAELNLRNAQVSADEEVRLNENSITSLESTFTAQQITVTQQQTAVANAEKDLREAQADAEEPFDSYTYDKAVEDARINVVRREQDLADAQADLDEAKNDFDDYAYQNAINTATITLERANEALADAQANLREELDKDDEFDTYTYQKAIDAAQKTYDSVKKATVDASDAVDQAIIEYNNVFITTQTLTQSTIDAAKAKVTAAENALEKAKENEQTALDAVNQAKTDMQKAKDDYDENAEEAKDATVKNLQNLVDNAANTQADAQRALDKANTDLARAMEDAVSAAQKVYDTAQNNVFDARRAHEKAISDKDRAIEDYPGLNADKIEAAQRTYDNARKQLEAAQNSMANAENSLTQAGEKPLTAGTTVDIQQISLNKLKETLEEAEIIATEDGVITELYAKVGAPPTGIMFVIEDANDLYVSANIKEYSLSNVALGQKAFVTTDATGDAVFDAEVNYISPKAVSAAGSTSVEFEIRAGFDGGDAVKIGMNAFLNVVTETREAVYSVPLSAIVTDERGSFVYSPNGAERIEMPVTVGVKTTTQGEITGEGLRDGLVLLTQPTELPRNDLSGMMMFGG